MLGGGGSDHEDENGCEGGSEEDWESAGSEEEGEVGEMGEMRAENGEGESGASEDEDGEDSDEEDDEGGGFMDGPIVQHHEVLFPGTPFIQTCMPAPVPACPCCASLRRRAALAAGHECAGHDVAAVHRLDGPAVPATTKRHGLRSRPAAGRCHRNPTPQAAEVMHMRWPAAE